MPMLCILGIQNMSYIEIARVRFTSKEAQFCQQILQFNMYTKMYVKKDRFDGKTTNIRNYGHRKQQERSMIVN